MRVGMQRALSSAAQRMPPLAALLHRLVELVEEVDVTCPRWGGALLGAAEQTA